MIDGERPHIENENDFEEPIPYVGFIWIAEVALAFCAGFVFRGCVG